MDPDMMLTNILASFHVLAEAANIADRAEARMGAGQGLRDLAAWIDGGGAPPKVSADLSPFEDDV